MNSKIDFVLRLLLVLICFLSISFCYSQDYIYTIDEYGFEDGLINNQINTLFEDNKGIIWLGTTKGVTRFDGEEFLNIQDNESKLLSTSITRITQDDQGIIWLWDDVNEQFIFLDPQTYKVESTQERFGDKFPPRFINTHNKPGYTFSNSQIFRSSLNEIYFSTEGLSHFYKYHSKIGFEKIHLEKNKAPIKKLLIYGIINDTLHVSVDSVSNIKYKDEIEYYNPADSANILNIGRYLPNFQHHIPQQKTSRLFSNLEMLFTNYDLYRMSSITYDDENELIYHFDRNRWTSFNSSMDTIFNINAEDLKKPNLYINESCKIDKSGNVWIFGHFGLVRIKVKKNKFDKILYKKNGGNIAIRGITSDSKNIYVCGENTSSIYKFEKENLHILTSAKFDDYNRTINILSEDKVLIGGHYAFSVDEDLKKKKQYTNIPKDKYLWGENYGVWSSYIDPEETIWIGKGVHLAKKRKT